MPTVDEMEPPTEDWEIYMRKVLEDIKILEGDDLELYLILLKSGRDLEGKEITAKLGLKRSHIYSILNRMQKDGWIELNNPGNRPALYRGVNPLRPLEALIKRTERNLKKVKKAHASIKKNIAPLLTTNQFYGGRISNTFMIPTISELHEQIIRHLKQGNERIMMHVSTQLFSELKIPLLNSLNRIKKKKEAEGIRFSSEYKRDHFAMIVIGEEENEETQSLFPFLVIHEPGELPTQIIVIDDNVFFTNVGTGFGLAFRMFDNSAASIYATMITQTFIQKECHLLGKSDLNLVGKYLAENKKIRSVIKRLFDLGWKIIPDHSLRVEHEIGLFAPGLERAFYRICSLQFFPFTENESKEQRVKELFEENLKYGKIYIDRIKRQFTISAQLDQVKLYNHDCYVYKILFEVRKEWIPIMGDLPKLKSADEKGVAIVMAVFNFEEKGAMCVWSVNADNTNYLLKLLLKKE